MARSTKGVNKTDLPAYLNHMQNAVIYNTTQTTGTVMRSTPNGKPRKLPATRAAPRQFRPQMFSNAVIDLDYLAAHPYIP